MYKTDEVVAILGVFTPSLHAICNRSAANIAVAKRDDNIQGCGSSAGGRDMSSAEDKMGAVPAGVQMTELDEGDLAKTRARLRSSVGQANWFCRCRGYETVIKADESHGVISSAQDQTLWHGISLALSQGRTVYGNTCVDQPPLHLNPEHEGGMFIVHKGLGPNRTIATEKKKNSGAKPLHNLGVPRDFKADRVAIRWKSRWLLRITGWHLSETHLADPLNTRDIIVAHQPKTAKFQGIATFAFCDTIFSLLLQTVKPRVVGANSSTDSGGDERGDEEVCGWASQQLYKLTYLNPIQVAPSLNTAPT
ncbi:hypothetical protein F5141DRAFT_1062872 [Pisolithus sp. B1]|nr:hypothetical protein F5141DRAFT_1062872 [Pisolithus sp. B1]